MNPPPTRLNRKKQLSPLKTKALHRRHRRPLQSVLLQRDAAQDRLRRQRRARALVPAESGAARRPAQRREDDAALRRREPALRAERGGARAATARAQLLRGAAVRELRADRVGAEHAHVQGGVPRGGAGVHAEGVRADLRRARGAVFDWPRIDSLIDAYFLLLVFLGVIQFCSFDVLPFVRFCVYWYIWGF